MSLPVPPEVLMQRVGRMDVEDVEASYLAIGTDLATAVRAEFAIDLAGRKVLDFGSGAGRVLRHFEAEAQTDGAEFWGVDIDQEAIDWAGAHLSPPFHFATCAEEPGLPFPDGHFDAVYAFSVFTHLTEHWAGWLAELHRVLAPGGLLFATVLGRGWTEAVWAADYVEDEVGMRVHLPGRPWHIGGPVTVVSPWWIEAHWGRAFDLRHLTEPGTAHPHLGPVFAHEFVVGSKRDVEVDIAMLTADADDPREQAARDTRLAVAWDDLVRSQAEIGGLYTALEGRVAERDALQRQVDDFDERPAAPADPGLAEALARVEAERDMHSDARHRLVSSKSYRYTAPLRAAAQRWRARR